MYQEQYDRMKRLMFKIDPPSGFHGEQKEYEDNLWYFFQSAWHLKDWIKVDRTIQTFDIEKIVNSVRSLRLCADVANRTKHLEISNIREDARPAGNDVTIHIGVTLVTKQEIDSGKIPIRKSGGNTYKYYINDRSGNKYPAIELAKQIIKDWDDIIENYVRQQP